MLPETRVLLVPTGNSNELANPEALGCKVILVTANEATETVSENVRLRRRRSMSRLKDSNEGEVESGVNAEAANALADTTAKDARPEKPETTPV